jgi:hypothetical protein
VELCSHVSSCLARVSQLIETASNQRRIDSLTSQRQRQLRLSDTEVARLTRGRRRSALITDLAQQFMIHRTTVMALLRRHDVPARDAG